MKKKKEPTKAEVLKTAKKMFLALANSKEIIPDDMEIPKRYWNCESDRTKKPWLAFARWHLMHLMHL
jgi:hypothetical protein